MSKKPKPRTDIDRARAASRLAQDGELRTVSDLTGVAGVSPKGIVRWITEGRSGVYLDGINDRWLGWCSTVAAVQRFHREYAARKKARAGDVSRAG